MDDLLVAIGVGLAIWAIAAAILYVIGRRIAAEELTGLIPALLRLFRDLFRDPRVGAGPKVWLALGAVYLMSPIDVLPEFIPVIGPVDDAVVAALVVRHLVRRTGHDVVREHWTGGPKTLALLLRVAGRRSAG